MKKLYEKEPDKKAKKKAPAKKKEPPKDNTPKSDAPIDNKAKGNDDADRPLINPETPGITKVKDTEINPIPEKGKRFTGKSGDWVINQTEIRKTNGSIEIENQETYDKAYFEYSNGKWSLPLKYNGKNVRISHKNFAKVIEGFIDLYDSGDAKLGESVVKETKLRDTIQSIIREVIEEEELEEVSNTSNVQGYSIPHAFAPGNDDDVLAHDKSRKNNHLNIIKGAAEQLGYKLVKDNAGLYEGRRGKYHNYRDDESLTPKQKIGHAMRELRQKVREINQIVDMNLRLKNEMDVDSRDYWKRAHSNMIKAEEQMNNILIKMKKMR